MVFAEKRVSRPVEHTFSVKGGDMRFSGLLTKAMPVICVAGLVIAAGITCQKTKSANAEGAAAGAQMASDSMIKASMPAPADTTKKMADSAAVNKRADSLAIAAQGGYYTCPMHPQIHQSKPGKCPICGMNLVFKKNAATATKMKSVKHTKKKK
jgi:hypothetical protein